MAWTEVPWKRTSWSRTYRDGTRRAISASLAPIHWKRGPNDFVSLDTTMVQEASRWALVNHDYYLYVNNDGWVEVGPSQGEIWLRWRIASAGFLHWPTRTVAPLGGAPTFDPLAVETVNSSRELPDGEVVAVQSRLLWPELWTMPGGGRVDLRLLNQGLHLKSEVVLNQAARDYLGANLPAWPAAETFLGFALDIDWSGIPRVTRDAVDVDTATTDFADSDGAGPPQLRRIVPLPSEGDSPREDRFRDLVAMLPVGFVASSNERIALVRRYWPGRVFMGQRLSNLAVLSPGDLVFDPTVDVTVPSNADDGRCYSSSTLFSNATATPYLGYRDSSGYYDCHQYFRWTGITLDGTIEAAWVKIRSNDVLASSGSPQLSVYAVDEDNPAAPTTAGEFSGDPLTSAFVIWDEAWLNDTWEQSPSLVAVVQEITDAYTISSDAVMIQVKNRGVSSGNHWNRARHRDDDAAWAAEFYAEYSTGPLIYTIDFEEGDETDIDGTSETANVQIEVHADAALVGTSYGMKTTLIASNDEGYAYRSLSAPSTGYLRTQFRFKRNTLVGSTTGQLTGLMRLYTTAPGSLWIFSFYKVSDGYRFRIYVYDDSVTEYNGQGSTLSDDSKEFTVLIETERATSAVSGDGTVHCYVDGEEIFSKTDLDNYDRWALIDEIQFGIPVWGDSTFSGVFYMDEFSLFRSSQLYEKSLSGQLYMMGELERSIAKVLASAITPTGVLTATEMAMVLSGAITPSGDLVILPMKTLVGTIVPEGTITAECTKALSGEIEPSGALYGLVEKGLSGSITPSGDLVRYAAIAAKSSGITPTGTIVSELHRRLTSSFRPTSKLVKSPTRELPSSVSPSSTLTKLATVFLDGAITPSGDVTALPVTVVVLASSIAPSGELTKEMTKVFLLKGSISPTSKLVKLFTRTAFTGSVSFAGDMTLRPGKALSSSIWPSAEMTRVTQHNVRSSIKPVGTLKRQGNIILSGAITPGGVLTGVYAFFRDLVSAISPSGGLTIELHRRLDSRPTISGVTTKEVQREFSGSVSPTGTFRGQANKALPSSVSLSGDFGIQVIKVLESSVTPVSIVIKEPTKKMRSYISPTGKLVKQLARQLAGAVETITGALTREHILSTFLPSFESRIVTDVEEDVVITLAEEDDDA